MNHLTGILETKSGLQCETDLYLGRQMLPTDWALPVPSRWHLAGCFASVYCCRSSCSGCKQRPTALFLPFLGPPRVYLNTRKSEKHIQMVRKKRIRSWLSPRPFTHFWASYVISIWLGTTIEVNTTMQWATGSASSATEPHSHIINMTLWLMFCWLAAMFCMLDINAGHQACSLVNKTLNYNVDFHWKAYFKYSSSQFSTPQIHSKLF